MMQQIYSPFKEIAAVRFFKIENILLLMWILVFVNFSNLGYLVVFIVLIFLLAQPLVLKKIDISAFFLIWFCVFYTFFSVLNEKELGLFHILKYLVPPIVAYVSGRLLTEKASENKTMIALFLFSVSFSIMATFSIILDISTNGIVTIYRDLAIIGLGEEPLPATLLVGYLSLTIVSVGIILTKANDVTSKVLNTLALLIGLLVLLCAIRQGSRTCLVMIALGLGLAFVFNFKYLSNKTKLSVVIIISVIFIAVLGFIANNEELLAMYEGRIGDEDMGSTTAGGRTSLWNYYLTNMFNYPFGGIPRSIDNNTYAHNIFLDIARRSGIIPLAFICIFLLITLSNTYIFLKKRSSKKLKTQILLLTAGICAQFMVEPILEGLFMLFVFFCFLAGAVRELNETKGISDT